jgi:hypothetical protein
VIIPYSLLFSITAILEHHDTSGIEIRCFGQYEFQVSTKISLGRMHTFPKTGKSTFQIHAMKSKSNQAQLDSSFIVDPEAKESLEMFADLLVDQYKRITREINSEVRENADPAKSKAAPDKRAT